MHLSCAVLLGMHHDMSYKHTDFSPDNPSGPGKKLLANTPTSLAQQMMPCYFQAISANSLVFCHRLRGFAFGRWVLGAAFSTFHLFNVHCDVVKQMKRQKLI